ncbi:hypothetical protein HK405_000531 [Cladochytrium tenue]|nr:hypothetical protein HK405_000531 [Cladochytrium tenue]
MWSSITAAAGAAVFLAAAAAGSVRAQNSTDPCASLVTSNTYFVNGQTGTPSVVTGAELFACYGSFTVNDTVKASQVSVLKSYLNLYPYADIAKSSSSPNFASQVDIMSALDAIAADTTVTTEFQFQTKIQAALNSLYDAHISYSPKCFGQMALGQPFVIDARYKAGSAPTLYIRSTYVNGSAAANGLATTLASLLTSTWSSVTNGDPATYVNYTIKTINSIDAVQYIQYIADYWTSNSHTAASRFNGMLPRVDWNNVTSNVRFNDGLSYILSNPPSDMNLTWTYELQSPAGETTTLSNVPWLGFFAQPTVSFTDSASYYQKFCSSSTTSALKLTTADRVVPPTRDSDEVNLDEVSRLVQEKTVSFASADASSVSESKSAFSIASPKVQGEATSFHVLDDGTTGIFFLTSFSPSTGNKDNFLATAISGLKALETAGVTKLIIDLTGNSGGVICLGDAIMKYMMNQGVWLPFDFRLTQSSTSIASWANTATGLQASRSSGGLFAFDSSIVTPVQGSSVLNNTVTYTRGGGPSVYSGKFYLNCPTEETAVNAMTQLSKGWSPDAMVILTDGLCGSTCGHFTRVMRDEYGVKAYVTGGSTGATFQPSTFEGANVGSWDAVRTEALAVYQAQSSSISQAEVDTWPLKAFPLSISGQLPLWESYSPKGTGQLDAPAEWVASPADAYLDVADVTDKASVWSAAASAFAVATNAGKTAGAAQATATIETNGGGTVGNVSTASATKTGGAAPGAGAAGMAAATVGAAFVAMLVVLFV